MANKPKIYYIKERNNESLKKPYYAKRGKLTMKEALKIKKCLYGTNIMYAYDTLEQYEKAAKEFETQGYTVYDRN